MTRSRNPRLMAAAAVPFVLMLFTACDSESDSGRITSNNEETIISFAQRICGDKRITEFHNVSSYDFPAVECYGVGGEIFYVGGATEGELEYFLNLYCPSLPSYNFIMGIPHSGLLIKGYRRSEPSNLETIKQLYADGGEILCGSP